MSHRYRSRSRSYHRYRSRSPGQTESDSEYENRHGRDRFESDTDYSFTEPEEDEEVMNDEESDKEDTFDFTSVVLCKQHKAGFMTRDCQTCSQALKLIKDEETVNKLLAPEVAAMKAGLVSRYGGRCDDTVATLVLSPSMVEVASQVFSKGTFKDSNVWKDVVKKFLILSPKDHDKLSMDIKSEGFFSRFKQDKRYDAVFKYHQEMDEAMKNLRIAQRPIFKAIDHLNGKMEDAKKLATRAGIQFPDVAPKRSSDLVPRNGRDTLDELKISSSDGLFPIPDVSEFISETGIDGQMTNKLLEIFSNYRVNMTKDYMELYNITASTLNDLDDLMIFYLDLYSHVDSSLRELIRNKVASLFKADVKSNLLLQSSSHKMKGKSEGLFGGDDKMRAVIKESARTEAILSKAVIPRYRSYRRSSGDEHRNENYRRRRDDSRSPRRYYNSSSHDNRSRHSKKGGGGDQFKGSRNNRKGGEDESSKRSRKNKKD